MQEQIVEMTEGLDLIFKTHKIDEVSIEDMFYAFNPKTVIKPAQFRGAISLKILHLFTPLFMTYRHYLATQQS